MGLTTQVNMNYMLKTNYIFGMQWLKGDNYEPSICLVEKKGQHTQNNYQQNAKINKYFTFLFYQFGIIKILILLKNNCILLIENTVKQ